MERLAVDRDELRTDLARHVWETRYRGQDETLGDTRARIAAARCC